MITKIILVTLVVSAINLLARFYPSLGGFMAVLPTVSFLSFLTLLLDKQNRESISKFLKGALLGKFLALPIFLAMLYLLHKDVPYLLVLFHGLLVWLFIVFMASKLLSRRAELFS